jgi:hypothetical protein
MKLHFQTQITFNINTASASSVKQYESGFQKSEIFSRVSRIQHKN